MTGSEAGVSGPSPIRNSNGGQCANQWTKMEVMRHVKVRLRSRACVKAGRALRLGKTGRYSDTVKHQSVASLREDYLNQVQLGLSQSGRIACGPTPPAKP